MPWTSISIIRIFDAGETLRLCIKKYQLRLGCEMQSQYRVLISAVSCNETQYLGMKSALPFLIFFRILFSCITRLLDSSGWFSSRLTMTNFFIIFSGLKAVSGKGPITSFSEPEKTYQYQISVMQMLENPPELILVRCSLSWLLILMKLRIQLFQNRFLHFMRVGERILLWMLAIQFSVKRSLPLEESQDEVLQKRDSWFSQAAVACTKAYSTFSFLSLSAAQAQTILDYAFKVEGMLSPTPILMTVLMMLPVLGVTLSAQLEITSVWMQVPARVYSRQSLRWSKLQYLSSIQVIASWILLLAMSAPLKRMILTCPFSGWNENTIFLSGLDTNF